MEDTPWAPRHTLLHSATKGQIRIQLIDAQRKISIAAKPSTERTACSLPQRSINTRLSEPALAERVRLSCLLVGLSAKSV